MPPGAALHPRPGQPGPDPAGCEAPAGAGGAPGSCGRPGGQGEEKAGVPSGGPAHSRRRPPAVIGGKEGKEESASPGK